MSGQLPVGSMLLPSECSIMDPYYAKDRETFVYCKRQQGFVYSFYIAIVSLIILALIYYNRPEETLDPTRKNIIIGIIILNILLFFFMPWYKERKADLSYDQYEREYKRFHRSNPSGRNTLQDYINWKMGEQQTRASSKIAGAQQIMSGAFALDALASVGSLLNSFRK